MRRVVVLVAVLAAIAGSLAAAEPQRRRAPAKKTPPQKSATTKTVTPEMKCPSLIGMGVKTIRSFCDVPAGRDPAQGIVLVLPPHTGEGSLTFDLHARHTYSEEETSRGKAYSHYRAVIGVLTMKGDVLGRGAVDAEFRNASDLFDRIGGGAGPEGLKAVAPLGREQIFVTIPASVDQVSLLGETLDAVTPAGHDTIVMPGRPVAIVSNVLFEYHPAPRKRR
jgi:hypothetical protein